jgi:hypothetical protein
VNSHEPIIPTAGAPAKRRVIVDALIIGAVLAIPVLVSFALGQRHDEHYDWMVALYATILGFPSLLVIAPIFIFFIHTEPTPALAFAMMYVAWTINAALLRRFFQFSGLLFVSAILATIETVILLTS